MELIALDLDNTLLRTDKTISEYSLSVLKRLRDKGSKVAFATARSESVAQGFINAVEPDAVISNSGSLVRIGNKAIYKCTLSKEASNGILYESLKSEAAGFITLETDSGYYVNWKYPFSKDYAHAIKSDFSRPLTEDTYKITIQFSNSETARKIADKFPECRVIATTGEEWYFFTNKNTSKMDGVRVLASYLGIGIENVISFGDDFSDIEMLRGCGVGVAMGNAIAEVKAVANYVCGTNDEDGSARWLDENMLQKII